LWASASCVLLAARDVGLEQRDRLREVLGVDLVHGLAVFRIDRGQLAVAERGHAAATTTAAAAPTAAGGEGRQAVAQAASSTEGKGGNRGFAWRAPSRKLICRPG
jgi:hypothetical protein